MPLELSEPQRDGHAAQAYGQSGQGVAVALEGAERQALYAKRDGKYHPEHRGNGGDAEYEGDPGGADDALFGGGEYEDRYEGFTRAQHKNGKEHPGREAALFGFMDVCVLAMMRVAVGVYFTVGVQMHVGMWAIPVGLTQPPDHIGAAEENERPGRQIAAIGFDRFEAKQRDAHGETDCAKKNGTEHVSETTERGDCEQFEARPAAGLAHHDEGQVVVGAHQRVNETDGSSGDGEQLQAFCHFEIWLFGLNDEMLC